MKSGRSYLRVQHAKLAQRPRMSPGLVPIRSYVSAPSLRRRPASTKLPSMKKGLTRHWAEFSERLYRDPASRKWMVVCLGCGRAGLRADTPGRFWNRPWLERLGRIRLDEMGLC